MNQAKTGQKRIIHDNFRFIESLGLLAQLLEKVMKDLLTQKFGLIGNVFPKYNNEHKWLLQMLHGKCFKPFSFFDDHTKFNDKTFTSNSIQEKLAENWWSFTT